MGGPNSNQLIEYVHSYDTRSWSCLHVSEGGLLCNNVVVQNNDIGPCGSDRFFQWADGISVSCRSAVVRNNEVTDATDGGIVLFGSPGTLVEDNTIRVIHVRYTSVYHFSGDLSPVLSAGQSTSLGGINMVDFLPWNGDYTGTVVQSNTIMGGFATGLSASASQHDGENVDDAIIKSVIFQRARHIYLQVT
jgi:parallel beta-helix repeat protein